MTTFNITQIPSSRVPFVDERTGLMSREWYRWFINVFTLLGQGTTAVPIDTLEDIMANTVDTAGIVAQAASMIEVIAQSSDATKFSEMLTQPTICAEVQFSDVTQPF